MPLNLGRVFMNENKPYFDILFSGHPFALTKEKVLDGISEMISECDEAAKHDYVNPAAHYSAIRELLEAFRKTVENAVLFDETPKDWAYSLHFEYDKFSLSLVHISDYISPIDKYSSGGIGIDASYELIKREPLKLTVAEFADLYKVPQVTVRQWIRRGKIRVAEKKGNEWLISELAGLPRRGYESATYIWDTKLEKLPEEYVFLNNYDTATFYQDDYDKTIFHVLFTEWSDSDKKYDKKLGVEEKEKLELFMIANPQIRYRGLLFD